MRVSKKRIEWQTVPSSVDVFQIPGRPADSRIVSSPPIYRTQQVNRSDIWLPYIDAGTIAPLADTRLWHSIEQGGYLDIFGKIVMSRLLTDAASEKNERYFLDALGDMRMPGVLTREELQGIRETTRLF